MNQYLAMASDVVVGGAMPTEDSVSVVTADAKIYIPMKELVDFDKERERLSAELKKTQDDLAFFEKKLSNPGFVNNAPAAVVEKDKASAAKLRDKAALLEESLRKLG